MKKLQMKASTSITFEDGCNKYLDYCRQRNSREGTINHYKQGYVQSLKKHIESGNNLTFTLS